MKLLYLSAGMKAFKMKVFFIILIAICFGINLLKSIIGIFIEIWGKIMSAKNRKVIMHWDWLDKMGYEEAALFILQRMKK